MTEKGETIGARFMIGRTISHYRIVDKLGEGGMGVVYKAEDTKLERMVALKFLPAHLLGNRDVRKRFEREAKSAAALDHPNVCHVHEIDEADGQTFISMSLIEGESLDKKIACGPLKLDEALSIAQQVAKGLEAAHKRGIVHRDIKPENIMVGEDGHVTIMDFGLAQLTEASRLTKTDETVGTVAYMSPEQTEGSGTDRRTDIWSLGVVLYEMVTGQQPFQGDYDKAVMYSILNEEPEPMTSLRTGVPMQLEDAVGKCLAKDRTERYQDASHLDLDLKTVQKQAQSGRSRVMTAARVEPIAAQRSEASVWDRALPWAAAGLLGLLAAGLGFIHFMQAPPIRPVRRFSFTPESMAPASLNKRAAVSPDGRWIAYVSGDEPSAIWIRPIDTEEPRQLEGTDGALPGLSWSPDSAFIAFAADGKVKRALVQGGAPIVLCEYPGVIFSGSSWSPDGRNVVFSSGTGVPSLHVVSSAGGEPKDFIDPVRGRKGYSNLDPYFLPVSGASEAMLFDVGVSENRDVYLWDGASGESRLLVEGAYPVFSPPGYILYQPETRQPGLWALPFSLQSLEVTGEPFPIAEGMESGGISADGILVTVDLNPPAKRQLTWRSRHGDMVGRFGRPLDLVRSPSVSPDGSRVAAQGSEEGDRELWIHEVGRDVGQKVTYENNSPRWAAWSPDGRELVYSDRRKGGRRLYIIRADGSDQPKRLTSASEGHEIASSWSPDGRHIIYSAINPQQDYDLWVVDRLTTESGNAPRPFLQSPYSENLPQISPDGRYVAYVSDETGTNQVYVREFPTGPFQKQVSENGGHQPQWGRDGTELLYLEGDVLVAVAVTTDSEFTMETPKRLFSSPDFTGLPWTYDVAPDGRIVVTTDVEADALSDRKPSIHITENWYQEFRDREHD